MIFQLHWQDRSDPSRTEFIAQSEDASTSSEVASVMEDFLRLTVRHYDGLPEGWMPMVCNEESEHFAKGVIHERVADAASSVAAEAD